MSSGNSKVICMAVLVHHLQNSIAPCDRHKLEESSGVTGPWRFRDEKGLDVVRTKNRAHRPEHFYQIRMRNAVTLGVSQDRLDLFRRDFKLFCNFSSADATIEVIDDGVDRHPSAAQHRSAALHSRLDFDERAFRPVNFFHGGHKDSLINMIPCFHLKSQSSALKTFGLR